MIAVMGAGVIGSLMGGWSSANKFSLLGGIRVGAQLVAYELPFVLAAASVAMAAGTLSLTGIAEAWTPWWLLWQGIGPWSGFGPAAPFYVGAALAFAASGALAWCRPRFQ